MRISDWSSDVCSSDLKMGDIRKVAKEIEANHPLALELWDTGNLDARLLAILLMKPKELSTEDLDRKVRSNDLAQVADWLMSYVVKQHPEKEKLRQQWMVKIGRAHV